LLLVASACGKAHASGRTASASHTAASGPHLDLRSHPDLLFEARGLLAAADLAAGEAARGCGALRSLADTASSQGFALAASQAGSLLRGTPACKQAAPPGG